MKKSALLFCIALRSLITSGDDSTKATMETCNMNIMHMGGTSSAYPVTEEEINDTIQSLSKKHSVKHMSKRWISVMLGRSDASKKKRRDLDVSKSEIQDNLAFIQLNKLDQKITSCLEGNCEDYVTHRLNQGCFYWYGVDNEGSPNLFYRIENFDWKTLDISKQMDFSSIILHGAVQEMPQTIHDFNFIMLVDNYPVMEMIKHPSFGVAFLKTFLQCSPGRLKRCIMVTGRAGEVFYKIAKRAAPRDFVDRITTVPSREKAVKTLLEMQILPSKNDVPDFLGGSFVHGDEIVQVFSNMMSKIRKDMFDATH